MWFFVPAGSSTSVNLERLDLLSLLSSSLAGLLLGESTYSCQRPLPCHLRTYRMLMADAALPLALVSDSKAWRASISRSCLLIAIDQEALNMSTKIEWERAEPEIKDLAYPKITHFMPNWCLSSRLLVLPDDWAGHFPTNTRNTATDSDVCLSYPTLPDFSLSYDLFSSLAKGFVPKLPRIFIREKTPNYTHKFISFYSPIESFVLSYYIL